MKRFIQLSVAMLLIAYVNASWAVDAKLITAKQLPQFTRDQEVNMLTIEYGPGESSPIHRHNAHTFVYILEGSLMMQVRGGELVTLSVGDSFYENPEDVHVLSKNASATESAKFLVFFIKPQGVASTVAE